MLPYDAIQQVINDADKKYWLIVKEGVFTGNS